MKGKVTSGEKLQWISTDLQICCEYTKTTKYWKWWIRVKNIWEKPQDKNETIIHITIINARLNQDETQLIIWCRVWYPSYRTVRQYHLDAFQPSHLLGRNIITVTFKKCSRWDGWLNAEETSCNKAPVIYFNASGDKSILYSEGNACGII